MPDHSRSVAAETRLFSHLTYAVIVGLTHYQNTGLCDLPACAPEAEKLAAALSNPKTAGVPAAHIRHLPETQATSERILEEITLLAKNATPEGTILFYFAGHGKTTGNGFSLYTRKADGGLDLSLTGERISRALEGTLARGILVILDCCEGAGFIEQAPDLFRRLERSEFRILISASKTDQNSWELPEGSVFTRRLLRVLNGEVRIARRGAIYFTDLYEYLRSGVTETMARRVAGREQDTVALALYEEDPLLFLTRNFTLTQVRRRLRRITPEVLRRRIIVSAITVLTLVAVGIGLYWAYLDRHNYLTLKGDLLTLVHGAPRLSGFGLPKDTWIYSPAIHPNDVFSGALDTAHGSLTDDRSILAQALRPDAQARVRGWTGDVSGARATLLAAHGGMLPLRADLGDVLSIVMQESDLPSVEAALPNLNAEDAQAVIEVAREIDAERAATLALSPSSATDVGRQLNLLQGWQSCGLQVKSFFEHFKTLPRSDFYSPALARDMYRAGCEFPLEWAIYATPDAIGDAILALRLSNPTGAATLARMVFADKARFAKDRKPPPPAIAARMAVFLRYLQSGPCLRGLLAALPDEDIEARLDATVALSRNCPGSSLAVAVTDDLLKVTFHSPDRELDAVSFSMSISSNDLHFALTALLDAKASGAPEAALRALTVNKDSQFRVAIVDELREIGRPPGEIARYAAIGQWDLERALLRWQTVSDPKASEERLLGEMSSTSDAELLGTIALIPLSATGRERIIAKAQSFDARLRTEIYTLLKNEHEVAQLLIDRDPDIRNTAALYLPARGDAKAIRDLAFSRHHYADSVFQKIDRDLHTCETIKARLDATPPWARRWVSAGIESMEIASDGMELAFQQLLTAQAGRQ